MIVTLLLALVGLAIGSFLNVVTLRYQPERRLFSFRDTGGRSRCPACGTTLRWYELLPLVSFVIQRGRCRSCTARLSFQYPTIELLAAAITVFVPRLVASQYGIALGAATSFAAPWWYYTLTFLWTLATLLLIVIAIVDIRHFIIPNGANVALAGLGALVTATLLLARSSLSVFQTSFLGPYALIAAMPANAALGHLLGALFGGAVFWCLWKFSRGRAMGFGDVKLALAAGFLLGWPDIALAVALSFVVGGAWGAALLAFHRRSMGDRIPFGPFFVLGTLLTVFLGRQLLAWYFGIFPG